MSTQRTKAQVSVQKLLRTIGLDLPTRHGTVDTVVTRRSRDGAQPPGLHVHLHLTVVRMSFARTFRALAMAMPRRLPILRGQQPAPYLPDPYPAPSCAPYRARIAAAVAPQPRPLNLSGAIRISTVLIILVSALCFFTIAATALFRDPLSQMAEAKVIDARQRAAEAERRAAYMALEQAVTQCLEQAEVTIAQLELANEDFARRVESALGYPLEAALSRTPTSLRRALITSDAVLYAWTNIVNAYVTRRQFDAYRQILSETRSSMQSKTLMPVHQQKLDHLSGRMQERLDAISRASIDALIGHNALDGQFVTRTIARPERR